MESVKVEAYAGCRAEEKPVAFIFKGERHVIKDILSRWYEEDVKSSSRRHYFKVLADDGRIYALSHTEISDTWVLEESY
ncbi:MAG: hypothetical protein Q8M92_03060 [Candidatus Subteraquimicrobiales bacterium]|nr:hypothetical protein [Candidatus Subteraquimicrobiales bacterium]